MCERYAGLLRAYKRAVAIHDMAVEALELARRTSPRHEYERLAHYVEQAHSSMELAANQLKAHVEEHDCFSANAAKAS